MIFSAPELDPQAREILGQIAELKTRLGYMLSEPRRWDGLLARTAFARAIRGSNSIEGINVTLDDAVAAAESEAPLDAADETWNPITGYRQAMTYVIQLARDPHFGYSADLIRSLHFMMMSYDLTKGPGQWRPGYIRVQDSETKRTVYEGPDAVLVPDLIAELVAALDEQGSTDPLVRAAMAHLNLTMIHPFRDGNGRMARALQTLVLARDGTLSPVFSSIEEYLGRNYREYYAILATVGGGAWHPENDAMPWIRFCLTAHYRQARTVMNRVDRMGRVWDALETEVKARGLPERMMLALADAAQGLRVRNPTYRKAAELSIVVASRDLKALVDQSLLEPHGEKRGRYYVGGPRIRAIRAEHDSREKSIPDPFTQLEIDFPKS